MDRRTSLKLIAAGIALAGSPFAFAALRAEKDYTRVSPPQPGGVNGQIEVLEFFSYGCPHCAELDPLLTAWRKNLPKDVVFRRVPVSFGRPQWAALGRLYLTLQAMGLAERLDPLVFDAIQNGRVALHDEARRNEWLAKQGVDVPKFNNTWRSFGIESLVKRAEQQSETYKVTGVPTIAVDGRYFAGNEQGFPALLRNTDGLIAMVRAEKAKK